MLQFHISKLWGAVLASHGVVIPAEEGIRLVFFDSDQKPEFLDGDEFDSAVITWDNFQGLDVNHGMFGSRITIGVRSTTDLQDVPGVKESEITLEVHKKNVHQIEPFQQRVAEYRSGKTDEDVDQLIDDVRDLLDR
jgi:hypothetical protein